VVLRAGGALAHGLVDRLGDAAGAGDAERTERGTGERRGTAEGEGAAGRVLASGAAGGEERGMPRTEATSVPACRLSRALRVISASRVISAWSARGQRVSASDNA
jgi:hypothetical protein